MCVSVCVSRTMQVIANLGLCVSVYDIRSIEGGSIHPGEGCSTYKVKHALCISYYVILYSWYSNMLALNVLLKVSLWKYCDSHKT